jgi:hypothetical protein
LKQVLAATAMVLAVGLVGCEHHFFRVDGSVRSQGGSLGSWQATPEGCSSDPMDGQPVGKSATVATFLWMDPHDWNPFRDRLRTWTRNAPLQLQIERTNAGFTADLDTIKTSVATHLDESVCRTIDITTQPGKPAVPGGRPTLSGTFHMDCQVKGSHLAANVRFSGCEF